MSRICGYRCEHNKSGICQISVCDKKSNISVKTEVQTFTRYIDPTITELQQENKQLKDNWNRLKVYIKTEIPEDVFINTEWFVSILDKMQELEGSDSNENN